MARNRFGDVNSAASRHQNWLVNTASVARRLRRVTQLPRLGQLVFPSSIGADKPMRGFHKVWLRVAKRAGLGTDVTPHVLRHSYASTAADLGFSELTIAALLGHRKASVTSRYAHHADAVLLQAADAVSDRIATMMGDAQTGAAIVSFKNSRG
jgi:integrase